MSDREYLFLFTLGPVQSFISQARKTRDLYAGSQLLSQLIAHAMDTFGEIFPQGEIIFPFYDTGNTKKEVSYPNRFVAKLKGDSADLKVCGKQIEDAVRAQWKKIAEEALSTAGVKIEGYWREQYFRQMEDFLEIHWLFVPMEGDDYRSAYSTIERMGGALKNIRPFMQLAERGIKCSLDGRYNAIFFSPKNKKTEQGVRVRSRFLINEKEGLSAVSLVKRCQEVNFPSTSTVALMDDYSKLTGKEKKAFDSYEAMFKKEKVVQTCIELFNHGIIEKMEVDNPSWLDNWCDDYDAHFLFEENLTEKQIPSEIQLKLLKQLQSLFKEKLKTRYYAVVLFDGDQMGKWLSGELLNENGKKNLKEFHTTLSRALAKFAAWARGYLREENKNGQTIYAGGDDFLGFVNLHSLFEVLRELRIKFDEIVNVVLSEFLSEKRLTFSAGVVIAHYKMPFSEVLKKVREVEKKAKNEGDRNAFAIAVMKHSGEIQETVYKWDHDPDSANGTSNLDALAFTYQKIDSKQKKGDFSNTFIQVLTDELQTLAGYQLATPGGGMMPDAEIGLEELMLKAEVYRLVERSFLDNSSKDKLSIIELSEKVWHLYEFAPKHYNVRPRLFVHALHIADFLNRKTTEQI